MRHTKLIIILLIMLSQTWCDSVDPQVYNTMSEILAKYHPEKSKELRECIIEEMQSKDEANKFSKDNLHDERGLAEEMEFILASYEQFCTTSRHRIEILSVIVGGIFFIGIVIVVAVCNNRLQTPAEVQTVETVV